MEVNIFGKTNNTEQLALMMDRRRRAELRLTDRYMRGKIGLDDFENWTKALGNGIDLRKLAKELKVR